MIIFKYIHIYLICRLKPSYKVKWFVHNLWKFILVILLWCDFEYMKCGCVDDKYADKDFICITQDLY